MINVTEVTALKEVILASNEVMKQLQPVQQRLQQAMDPFKGLDKNQAYFLTNEDGSVTVIQFGPQGQPGYIDAVPFPPDPVKDVTPQA